MTFHFYNTAIILGFVANAGGAGAAVEIATIKNDNLVNNELVSSTAFLDVNSRTSVRQFTCVGHCPMSYVQIDERS